MSRANIKTEALVVEAPGSEFKLMPIVLDEVRPNELLVEMLYSGICHTDLVLQQGGLPFAQLPAIPGHEGAGIVRALGSGVKDKSLAVGDHVLLSFTMCGTCEPCKANQPTLCHDNTKVNFIGTRVKDGSSPARLLDGRPVGGQFFGQSSFSRMSIVQENCVVRCPEPRQPPPPYYAPIGCGFLTGAGTVLNVLKPEKFQNVVIFGMGSVGLTALMATAYLNVRQIVAVDIVDSKLDMAKDLGATDVINSADCVDVVAKVKEVLKGEANFTIDCTGVPGVVEAAIACLARGGKAVSVGLPPPGTKIVIDAQEFVTGNKTYMSLIGGGSVPTEFTPELIAMHKKGIFPVDRLCQVYSVKDVEKAIADLHSGKVIKPIIHWD